MFRPGERESWREYVKPGFHGSENRIVESVRSDLFTQSTTWTEEKSRLILRLVRNRDRVALPPDLDAVRTLREFVPDQPISYETTLDEWTTYAAIDFLDTTRPGHRGGQASRRL